MRLRRNGFWLAVLGVTLTAGPARAEEPLKVATETERARGEVGNAGRPVFGHATREFRASGHLGGEVSFLADEDGFRPLFDGETLSGFMSAGGGEPGAGWVVQDGALVRKDRAGDIWTKERYGDFVLELEYQTEGNSGVFFRTDDPKDNVQTGIEVQIDKARGPGKHSVGAIYDCLAPSKLTSKDGEWNRLRLTARDNRIEVVINGETVIDMDLNEWDTPGQNPDGSKNKFRTALKEFKREGHIGFQDHGANVMYRAVRIKPLE